METKRQVASDSCRRKPFDRRGIITFFRALLRLTQFRIGRRTPPSGDGIRSPRFAIVLRCHQVRDACREGEPEANDATRRVNGAYRLLPRSRSKLSTINPRESSTPASQGVVKSGTAPPHLHDLKCVIPTAGLRRSLFANVT